MPNLGMLHCKKKTNIIGQKHIYFMLRLNINLTVLLLAPGVWPKHTYTHTAIQFLWSHYPLNRLVHKHSAGLANVASGELSLSFRFCVCLCVCTERTGMVPDLPRGQCFCAFVLCLSHRLESIWRMTLHTVTFHIRFFASVAAWSFRPLRQTINRSRHLCRGKYCVDKQCPHETSGHVPHTWHSDWFSTWGTRLGVSLFFRASHTACNESVLIINLW